MALAPIEVLIYALIVSGSPAPASCDLKKDKSVVCTNGITAIEDEQAGGIILTHKHKNEAIKVQAARDGRLLFSNGITSQMGSAGWIKFSNGVSARRSTGRDPGFMVSPDLHCTIISDVTAACQRR